MKSRRNLSIRRMVFIWVLIYALAMVVGAVLACIYSYESNENLPELAQKDAEYYSLTGEFAPETYQYRNLAFVYSADGKQIGAYSETSPELDFDSHAWRLIPDAPGGVIYRMLFDKKLDSWIGVVVAVALEDGSIYFMVRSLRSLQTVLIVLFISLTVFLLLSCLYSVLVIRNSRRTEELRREYVANVSHDLKSPIASIKALGESLYDGVITDEARRKKCLGIILREADRLESTVMSMLELSKTQSMLTGIEKSAVAPVELFPPVIERFSERCAELGISFTAPGNMEELPVLHTNAERVAVLTNVLLDNAIKFVSPGGHIALEAELGHRNVVFCVRDDGVGIEKSEQKRIFERFYTGNLARNTKGSGLGLAIADEIASALGEQLWVESSPNEGAAFYFTVGTK